MAFTQPSSNVGYTSDDLNRKSTLIRDYLEGTNSSAKYTAEEITTLAKDISSLELYESRIGPRGFPLESLGRDGPWEEIPDGVFYRGDTQFSPDVWASLNAFTARITVASVLNFETYAIWILRHTLEEERINKEVDDNLPAAAVWIIYAGQMVYHNAAKYRMDSTETRPPYTRSLRRFTKPFSMERWNFWKERFEFFQDHEVLKQITRDSAGEALSKMMEIERRHPEPKASEGSALPPSGLMKAVHVQGMSGAE